MMNETLNKLRITLSIELKNGMNFTFSAGLVWILIAFVWKADMKAYDKSVLTFIVGALLLPLALLFARVFKTGLKDKSNPLQPLGLWLNFAQLFYFPFLVFILIKMPGYFVMTLAIITGAHFFPYAWFYKTNHYAVFAGVISVGAMFAGLFLSQELMYLLPLGVSVMLFLLTMLLFIDSKKKKDSIWQ
jgi:hypothetical protein